MSKIKIRVGGVPEHFNLPIHLAIEEGKFLKHGIEIEWITYKGGTGEMTRALADDECDVCILLTEGIIAAIVDGNPSKIVSGYVKSPLIWGIHTGIDNPLTSHHEIYKKQYAISRNGSGSHLMPKVDALINGSRLLEEQFTVIKNLDGAIESLNKGETDVFYWEKYTTKPYVDKKIIKRIGEFITPWPCFVISATDKVIAKHPEELRLILKTIHAQCDIFMSDPEAIKMVSDRYQLKETDARRWFHATEWTVDSWVTNKMLSSVLYTLKDAGIMPESASADNLIWKKEIQ